MGFLRKEGMVYKPVFEVDLGPNSDEVYFSLIVKAPRMAGFMVKVFAWLMENEIIGMILMYFLKAGNLFHKLVSFAVLEESPLYVPLHLYEEAPKQEVRCIGSDQNPCERVQQAVECLPSISGRSSSEIEHCFRHWTIMDYSNAYNSGAVTPTEVAGEFIRAVEKSSSPDCNMSFFINIDANNIMQQAAESTQRYVKGKPLSVLDGVPIAIKDEIDCTPYPTTGGTTWLHKYRSCKRDASCVDRLRSCGAILVGKANMQELGAGVTGINPHYGATRNPYDTSRITGGSSSGSAAVVCAGLCPVALGVDGGGSVRMPAAICGVVGLKPTFGRIPHDGVLPLNWTVGMVGILAGSVEDALITYAAIGGESASDPSTVLPPEVKLPVLKLKEVSSEIKMAKYGKWFNDCHTDIQLCCANALDKLQKRYGWQTVEVTVPEIESMRLAHYVTIGSECSASLDNILQKLDYSQIGWDTRAVLSSYKSFDCVEYVKAQQIRSRQLHFFNKIFSKADVIVTPTTAVTAIPIRDDALKTGELDYVTGAGLVRYQIAGNFLGLPAVTLPIGYDKAGLPIGLQFIGRPWSEATLLHIAFALQYLQCIGLESGSQMKPQDAIDPSTITLVGYFKDVCMSEYRKPAVYYDLLKST